MESIIYVGIDVHKDTYSLCSFDMQKDIFFSQHTIKASTVNAVSYLKKISESNGNAITVCGYEAGPTGYRLCLDLQQQGFNCVIMALTSIAKTAKDKRGNNEAGKSELKASSCGVGKIDKTSDGTFSRPEVKEATGKAGRNGFGNHKLCGQGRAQMLARTPAYHSYKQVVLPTENILAIKQKRGQTSAGFHNFLFIKIRSRCHINVNYIVFVQVSFKIFSFAIL